MQTDRVIRIVIGAGLIIAGIILNSSIWIIGLFPLIAGIINRCPTIFSKGSSCSIDPPQKTE